MNYNSVTMERNLIWSVKFREKPHCISNVAILILNVNKSLFSVHSARMILECKPHCFSGMGKSYPPRLSWTRLPTSAKVRCNDFSWLKLTVEQSLSGGKVSSKVCQR